MMNGSSEREGFIGHDAQHMRGVLALRYPMKNGVIHNWDDMEKVRVAPSGLNWDGYQCVFNWDGYQCVLNWDGYQCVLNWDGYQCV